MTRTILICDDEGEATRGWDSELSSLTEVTDVFTIDTLLGENLTATIKELETRQLHERTATERPPEPTAIDTAALLVVDFDLLNLRGPNETSASETGERIAYLARNYSNCGFIVALNQFDRGATVFDLTLNGHLRSFADLNVSSKQLANPGLWSERRDKFRPWSWPDLVEADQALVRRAAAVEGRLDQPILETLGLDDDRVYPQFTREQLRFLGNGTNPKKTTFDELINDSLIGLQGKDRQTNPAIRARIAAARIHKWLERVVLPGQNILTDYPHLVARFPSLVPDESTDLDDWQTTTRITGDAPAIERLEAHTFDAATWLSRPAWVWPLLQTVNGIKEVDDAWAPRFDEYAFAEDMSQFIPLDNARDFTAEVDGPWNTRYVLDKDTVQEDDPRRQPPYSVDDVVYAPGVQFTL